MNWNRRNTQLSYFKKDISAVLSKIEEEKKHLRNEWQLGWSHLMDFETFLIQDFTPLNKLYAHLDRRVRHVFIREGKKKWVD